MAEYVVILVEPLIAGNIGSVARGMSNFGINELRMFNPCELGDDAYRFSKHGRFIIENANPVCNKVSGFTDIEFGIYPQIRVINSSTDILIQINKDSGASRFDGIVEIDLLIPETMTTSINYNVT